jgi:hypothetical protein
MKSIGIFTVATNKYLNYWQEMIASFDEKMGAEVRCTFYVFTDNPKTAEASGRNLVNNSRIVAIQIENLGWPDATLLRFELINHKVANCQEDVLMHLDADMLVHRGFDEQFDEKVWNGGIFLVAHPGFYSEYLRRNERQSLLARLKRAILDVSKGRGPIHPLGAWESSQKSKAFVPNENRNIYVCGATWGGRRPEFVELVNQLAGQTKADRLEGVMATWHDESHLNKWASENRFSLLTPNYCYAEPFSENTGLTKIIQAVDKGSDHTRQ